MMARIEHEKLLLHNHAEDNDRRSRAVIAALKTVATCRVCVLVFVCEGMLVLCFDCYCVSIVVSGAC